MTALTPREIMIKQSDGSVAKAEGSIGKLFLLAIMAGAFIALGAQGSLMASFNLTSDPSTFGIGKVVMGAVFPVGLMMVVLFAQKLHWLPAYGVDHWYSFIMPIIVSSIAGIAVNARQTRSSMLEVFRWRRWPCCIC